jgi:hypothetical protein
MIKERPLNIAFGIGVIVSIVAWVIMVLRSSKLAEMAESPGPMIAGTVLATISLVLYIKALKTAKDNALKGESDIKLGKPLGFVVMALCSSVFSVWYAYYLGLTI